MRITSSLHSQKGFTLVELIIGMTIFSVSMTAILALLSSTIESSIASRQEIVASNILREQVELIKNIRNTNVRNFAEWDKAIIDGSPSTNLTGGIFIVENNFMSSQVDYDNNGELTSSPVYLRELGLSFPSATDLAGRFTQSELKLDEKGRYNHLTGTGTNFASYIMIAPLAIDTGSSASPVLSITSKPQGYILDARVIVRARGGFREYDLKTVITDWKR